MKQYITFLLCLFTAIGFSQDKKVHLAHGLGGSSDSWSEFKSELESTCDGLEVTNFYNVSTEGIDVYSSGYISQLEEAKANENDIAIGHSFGGINLRYIDSQNAKVFGGYITVGSVHDGSPLADAALNGEFQTWIETACEEVINGPLSAIDDLIPFINLPSPFNSKEEDFICNHIYSMLISEAEMFIGSGTTVNEIGNNGVIANLPGASLPGIGIVCTTQGHPLWSLLDGHSSAPLINGHTIEQAAEFLEIKALSFGKMLSTLSTIIPSKWQLKRKLRVASRECIYASVWMRNSESTWNELIGAGGGVTWVQEETETWLCDCYDLNTGQPTPCNTSDSSVDIEINDVDNFSACFDDPQCWATTIEDTPIFGPDLPSDGLVPVNRQSLPGSIDEELVTNVSHFEEPTNDGVQQLLLKYLHPNQAIHPIFIITNCI